MIYAVLNINTGKGLFCQAGNPYPVILKKDGSCQKLGKGGYPVGILPGADYEDTRFELLPGDRFFIYSDGLTEAENKEREQFTIDRLMQHLKINQARSISETIESSLEALNQWSGLKHQNDDISLFSIEITR
jgi:sigma-B regulation protein RsbU (phosphoserine phosphatase)